MKRYLNVVWWPNNRGTFKLLDFFLHLKPNVQFEEPSETEGAESPQRHDHGKRRQYRLGTALDVFVL